MLTVITGPMFGGKTSKMFDLLDDYYQMGHRAVLFKPSNDKRYDDRYVCTHDGRKRAAYPIPKDKPEKLYDLALQLASLQPAAKSNFVPPTVFAIDEAQFFDTESFMSVIEGMLYKPLVFPTHPILIVSGLAQDSSGNPFGAMPYCLAVADDIIHCKAVCPITKRKNATRTYRKDKNNTNQIAVGGAEMYEPRSFEEWLKAQ